MAIIQVNERHLHQGHSAEFDTRGIRATRAFVVISNNATDWPLGIRDAVDPGTSLAIPKIGTAHPSHSFLRVRRIVPTPLGKSRTAAGQDRYAYDVRVDYDTQTDFAGVINFNGGTISDADLTFIQNPLLRPPKLQWGFEKIQIAKTHCTHISDDDGATWSPPIAWTALQAICNSAGQTFDPPLVDDLNILVGTLTRNQATYNPALARSYVGAVNSDVWLGLPPRTVKLDDWQASRHFESGVWYWEHIYRVLIHPENWDDVILNQGLGYVKDGKTYVARDADDLAHGQPVRLSASGAILDPADEAHFRRFRDQRREKPFDVLNIA